MLEKLQQGPPGFEALLQDASNIKCPVPALLGKHCVTVALFLTQFNIFLDLETVR